MWGRARVGSLGSGLPVWGQSSCHTMDSTWAEGDSASHKVKKALMLPFLPGGCSPNTTNWNLWGTSLMLGTHLQGQRARGPKPVRHKGYEPRLKCVPLQAQGHCPRGSRAGHWAAQAALGYPVWEGGEWWCVFIKSADEVWGIQTKLWARTQIYDLAP